jgi:hypothetical protein
VGLSPSHYTKLTFGSFVYGTGYYRDEEAFLMRVEEDATAFKPHGDLIYTYTRPSPSASGKGKSIAPLSPENSDAVVYEVYHVRLQQFYFFRCLGLERALPALCSGHMANTWLQRISSSDAAVYIVVYRSRVIHK